MNDLKVYGVIYLITNKINNKHYVGQTTDKKGFNGRYHGKGVGIERVYNHYASREKHKRNYNKHLYDAINKYGFESFMINECLDKAFSQQELNTKEQYWVKFHNSFNNGYNNNYGGENNKHTEETKLKISNSEKGKRGTPCSERTKTYLRELFKGRISPTKGKHHSKESKLKISESCKGNNLGNKNGMYSKKGIDCPNSKKVICINTSHMFNSIIEASIYYVCNKCGIGNCCRGSQAYTKSLLNGDRLKWMYYDDYIKGIKQVS